MHKILMMAQQNKYGLLIFLHQYEIVSLHLCLEA